MIKKIYLLSVLILPLLVVISLIGDYNSLLSGSIVFFFWSVGALIGMYLRRSSKSNGENRSFLKKAKPMLLYCIVVYSLLAILSIIFFICGINPFATETITNVQTLCFILIILLISIVGLLILRKCISDVVMNDK